MKKINDWMFDNIDEVKVVVYAVEVLFLLTALGMQFVSRNGFLIMSALIVGWALGSHSFALGGVVADYRKKQMFRIAPKQIRNMGEPVDGKVAVSVELNNGDVRMVEVPEEYHPSQDNGDLVLRLACPELFGTGAPLEGSLGEWA